MNCSAAVGDPLSGKVRSYLPISRAIPTTLPQRFQKSPYHIGQLTNLAATAPAIGFVSRSFLLPRTHPRIIQPILKLDLPPALSASFWQRYEPEEVTAALSLITGIILVFVMPALIHRISSILRWASRRLGTERSFYRQYRRSLAFDVRQLKLLGMAKPRDLEQVFIPLRIRDPIKHNVSASADPGEYATLDSALSYHSRVTILGDPGAGKTSLARHATLLAAEGKLRIRGRLYTPFYIALNEIKSEFDTTDQKASPINQPEEIMAAAMKSYGFPKAQAFVIRRLRAGSCLIFFDGFDELASDRRQDVAAAMIRRLAHNYDAANRIVVTSREAGFRGALFSAFETLEIEDLPLEQAHMFVKNWFSDNVDDGARLLQILDENRKIQSLASNPLMLAIVCITYDARGDLPSRRADLFAYCIDTLIELWDESRGVIREAAFSPQMKLAVLKNIAFDLHVAKKADCSKREFLLAVRKHLPEAGAKPYQDTAFVDEVIEHTGLIREKGPNTLAFQHLTFQEYLAARKIVDDGESGIAYLMDRVTDPWWAETVVLAAGILRDATDLIERIYQQESPNVADQIYLLLGRCLSDADLSDAKMKDEILARVVGLAYPSGQL
jgi:hypothetical protein